jgi:DNA mismatch repair protein MutS2
MILSSYPTLDLHGYDREYAVYKVKEFIGDSLKQKKYTIVIIHGIGEGILRNSVIDYLKKCKNVDKYETDVINTGCTIVNLKKNN